MEAAVAAAERPYPKDGAEQRERTGEAGEPGGGQAEQPSPTLISSPPQRPMHCVRERHWRPWDRLSRLKNAIANADPGELPARSWDLRLLPAALTGWAAAATTIRLPPSTGYAIGGTALLIAVVILLCARRWAWPQVLVPLPVPLLILSMVSLSAAANIAERQAGPVDAAIANGATIGAVAKLTSDPRLSDTADKYTGADRYLVEATLQRATSQGVEFTAATPVLIIASERWEQLETGQRVETAGDLRATGRGDDIDALLFAKTAPQVLGQAGPWLQYSAAVRSAFRQQSRELPSNAAQLLPGMVLGDRGNLGTGLETAMRRTGLTHLTAVSGANCAIVIGTVFLCGCAARLPRWLSAAAALAALAGFVLLVRPEPSVLRAAVMGTIGVAAVISGRGRKSPTLLCLAVIVLLAVDPWLSGSYAFILSVLATGGLIVFGPACAHWLSRWMPLWAAQAVAVPIAAQAFCAPVIVLLQPQLTTYSVVANVLVAPLIPLITIAGMCCVLAMLLCPPLVPVLLAIAGAGASWVGAVAHFFSSAPGAVAPWPCGAAGATLMAVLSLTSMATLWLLAHPVRLRVYASTVYRWCRAALPLPVAALIPGGVLGAAAVWFVHSAPPGGAPTDWSIVACDVGQGDGLVVRTDEHSAIVVDTGPEPAAMNQCLDGLSISTVPLLVLTHMHADHTGGVAGVLAGREVERALISSAAGGPGHTIDLLEEHDVDISDARRGATGHAGAVQWSTLWPAAGNEAASANNSSIVMWVTVEQQRGGPLSLLLTGDLERDGARRLLATSGQQPIPGALSRESVDVLKVAHHGAANGGTGFIRALTPELALISVGAGNEYGHPSDGIIAALRQVGSEIRRTDRDGRIYVGKQAGTLLTWSER
ncbi:ComEC/Rec2 family competence protein [Arthrobacter castelli]|uniref:ComEC/Rec2 family competence protein n=1 Tax=Arthrobacter castelli TaxID=271431 RepID=UPI00138B0825|nr:ComEC/Rec2 family competence protein [Arthrobacter castelli]